jgi:hypothetical protein
MDELTEPEDADYERRRAELLELLEEGMEESRRGESRPLEMGEVRAEVRRRLEGLLLEGLDSGPGIKVDAEYWERKRRHLLGGYDGQPVSSAEVTADE